MGVPTSEVGYTSATARGGKKSERTCGGIGRKTLRILVTNNNFDKDVRNPSVNNSHVYF